MGNKADFRRRLAGTVFLAILVALLNLWIVRRRSREEMLGEIAREKKNRNEDPGNRNGSQRVP
ncbi:MAG: hypothetical protein H7Y43_16230 [Akkermansiaceae bacterium]|nr:hypothetical protein [Verrucomicrobiales bacterium]